MSGNSYQRYKNNNLKSDIMKRSLSESQKLPEQFTDYMRGTDTRFCEISEIYLKDLTICDLKYLKPEDLIGLVPDEQYNHKLLMSIMVRRYLFRDDSDCDSSDSSSDESDNISDNRCKHKKQHKHHKHHNHHKKTNDVPC